MHTVVYFVLGVVELWLHSCRICFCYCGMWLVQNTESMTALNCKAHLTPTLLPLWQVIKSKLLEQYSLESKPMHVYSKLVSFWAYSHASVGGMTALVWFNYDVCNSDLWIVLSGCVPKILIVVLLSY